MEEEEAKRIMETLTDSITSANRQIRHKPQAIAQSMAT